MSQDALEDNTNNGDDFINEEEGDSNKEPELETKLVEETPKIGMLFDNTDEAYNYYNAYARKIGFSVRIKRRNQHKYDPNIYENLILVCSCEGKYNKVGSPKKPRNQKRFDCKAEFRVLYRDGKYKLTMFEASHTHALVPPDRAHLLPSQRKLYPSQKRIIDKMHSAGIKQSKIHSYLREEAGGAQNLNVIPSDTFNHVQKTRLEYLKKGDIKCLQEWFKQKQIENKHFFYSFWTDDSNAIRGVFFCDAKSRRDYKLFGDAMSFDTTFRTNSYNMVCAPFVGVNHHGQTTIFGCGLLDGETTVAVTWVLNTFLEAMGGIAPKVVFSDQAGAIINAISVVFPESHHRLCLWHINQNATKHLSNQIHKFKSFKSRFHQWLYESETVGEFQESWEKMLTEYDLANNKWLQQLYELRHKWSSVYGDPHFCAGMTTTQRSESINKYLKAYFGNTLILREFVDQYTKAMVDRREKERKADNDTSQTMPNLCSHWKVEQEAAKKYTNNVFCEFQKEYNRTLDVDLVLQRNDGVLDIYEVRELGSNKSDRTITYNHSDQEVFCTCRKFEFDGILCRHSLKLFRILDFTSLPSKYYLKRWTKEIIKEIVHDPSGEVIPHDVDPTSTARYSELSHMSQRITAKGALSDARCSLAKKLMFEVEKKIDAIPLSVEERENSKRKSNFAAQDVPGDDLELKDPKRMKRTGQSKRGKKNAFGTKIQKNKTKHTGDKEDEVVATPSMEPKGVENELCGLQGQTSTPTHIVNPSNSEEAQWFRNQEFDELLDGLRYPNDGKTPLSGEKLLHSIAKINDVAEDSTATITLGHTSNMNEHTSTVNTILKDEMYSRLSCTELLRGFFPNNEKNISIPVTTRNDLVEFSSNTSDSSDSDNDGLNNVIKACNVNDQLHKSVENNTLTPIKLVNGEAPVRWLETRLNVLHPSIQDNIESWEDVKGDGHCGFRAIAEQLGLSVEDGWKEVRRSMLAEMKSYENVYKPVFGDETFEEFESGLKCEDVIAPEEAWIKFPFMGNIVASVFHCVYIVLHPTESITYLPWRELPDLLHNRIIVVCNVDNGTHYVKIKLTENAPFPPISFCWKASMEEKEIKIWAHVYKNKFDEWENILYPNSDCRKRKLKPIDSLFPLTP